MSNEKIQQDVSEIVDIVLGDYDGDKYIDGINIYNKPDKAEVRELTDELLQIIFPGYYRDKSIKIYNPKNSLAVVVEDIFYHLNKQINLALRFTEEFAEVDSQVRDQESLRITKEFFKKIPTIREYVDTDLQAAYDGDPAAKSKEEIILAYPGIHAISISRIAHELWQLSVPVLPRLMTEYAHSETGIDIHPGATIGKYFFIDHGTGIVVGETSIIGNNVKIYQGVTIGALSTRGGQKLSGKKRHPTIEDNVTIYSGASVLGGETIIGENAVIGGNAFITSSIPANTRVSIKNMELDYKTHGAKKTEEVKTTDNW